MSFIIGIIVFVLFICLAIGLHEFGHFYFAKKFGAYVSEFMIGFGSVLYSKKRGETTYGVKSVLLGGYVKIHGMFAPGKTNRKTHNSKGNLTLAEQSRQASLSELPAGQEHRAFYRLSTGRKITILAAGPLMNLLLCVFSILIAANMIGIKQPSVTLGDIPECFITNEQISEQKASSNSDKTSVDTKKQVTQNNCENKTPAFEKGLKKGDKITKINDTNIGNWNDVANTITSNGSKPLTVTVDRNGSVINFEMEPVQINGTYKLGVSPQFERTRLSLGQSAGFITDMATQTLGIVVRLPMAVYQVGYDWYMGNERSHNSVLSIVGVAKISGDIAQSESSFTDKLVANLMLFASLNMALFIFNLIPLTPLDGGHIATCVWEWCRRVYSKRVLGKEFGYVDNAKMMPLTYVVVGLLMVMTIFLVIVDIFNPINI